MNPPLFQEKPVYLCPAFRRLLQAALLGKKWSEGKMRRAATIVSAVLLCWATSAWAALTNGDFEMGSAFWTATPDLVEFSIDEGAAPGEGTVTLHENPAYPEIGFSRTSLEQAFIIEPDRATLSFDYAITLEGGGGSETDFFKVSVNGVAYEVASTEGAEYAGDFTAGSWSLDVAGGHTTLAFLLLGEPDLFTTSVTIDNVTITGAVPTVPVPGALLLGAIGAGLVGRFRRGRTP